MKLDKRARDAMMTPPDNPTPEEEAIMVARLDYMISEMTTDQQYKALSLCPDPTKILSAEEEYRLLQILAARHNHDQAMQNAVFRFITGTSLPFSHTGVSILLHYLDQRYAHETI
jgi:hypothetical protein